jgi:hypothetical protein
VNWAFTNAGTRRTDDAVAAKDRFYRALDKALEHQDQEDLDWSRLGRAFTSGVGFGGVEVD